MTLVLAWILASLLGGALLLTRFAGLVMAVGWLVVALALLVVGGPLLIASAALRRLGLAGAA